MYMIDSKNYDNFENREEPNLKGQNEHIGNESKNQEYFLSNIDSTRGGNFYQDRNGCINLVEIPIEVFHNIGILPMPFRLTYSMAKHVFEQHRKELKLISIEDAVSFIVHVMNNFDHVRVGRSSTFIFSIENNRGKIGVRTITVEVYTENDNFLGIKTSGYDRISNIKRKPILWEKCADSSATDTASANVTSEPALRGGEQDGSASNQSMGLSSRKDNKIS